MSYVACSLSHHCATSDMLMQKPRVLWAEKAFRPRQWVTSPTFCTAAQPALREVPVSRVLPHTFSVSVCVCVSLRRAINHLDAREMDRLYNRRDEHLEDRQVARDRPLHSRKKP